MAGQAEFVSPKQAARAMGVSESSMKRWCDRGDLKIVRTAGGHRKLAISEVLRFVRERHHPLASPELLGLPASSAGAGIGLRRGGQKLMIALVEGDEAVARQVIFDLYLAQHPLYAIFDEVVAAAFHRIGDLWACREADVYQERRACQIILRILSELRKLLQVPRPDAWRAIGGTLEGDLYSVPTAIAEIVLRQCGFEATSLGSSLPIASLVTAVHDLRPKLFWLSVSHVPEGADFLGQFAELSSACNAAGTALVVGGRALTDSLRQQMAYSAYGDTMSHLEGFARAFYRPSVRTRREPATAGKAVDKRKPGPSKRSRP